MRMRLAIKADAQPCKAEKCAENQAFDARVLLIGESLANSAYALYPELKKITPKFDFEVVDKKVLGTASNASGKVVLFRPIQMLDLDDNAIAFIVGREMGHVIAKHHKNNAKTKIFFTVLTGVLFPAATLLSASSAAAQATTATTLMTSAASTVTSIVGSEVALSRIKPNQLNEADDIALALLEYGGITALDTAQSLEFIVKNENSVGWEKDLNLSIDNVRQLAGEPHEIVVEYEPLPEPDDEIDVGLIDQELTLADEIKTK
jgi:Zn-dependent protease with chaperone function